jgi:hypothetical protein
MLRYSIAREWLQGTVGGQHFAMRAYSGGGRGRRGAGAERGLKSFDIHRKEVDTKIGHVHGGPLFPGMYMCHYVANHQKFHECIRLLQTLTSLFPTNAFGALDSGPLRDRFYIHARGTHGSDGCIVPEYEADRIRLNKAVKAAGQVSLLVEEPGMQLPAAQRTGGSIA